MLVYAVQLRFADSELECALTAVASWLSGKTATPISTALLSATGERSFPDRSLITAAVDTTEIPNVYAIRYTHADARIKGRHWITEMGFRAAPETPLHCTVSLRTDEESSRAAQATQVTRPGVVHQLLKSCRHVMDSCTGEVKNLPDDAALAFRESILDGRRTYPFVLVSPASSGKYLVNIERLSDLVVGLAEVVRIPAGSDTYKIEEIIGRQLSAYAGAVNIIRTRLATRQVIVPNIRFLPDDLVETAFQGASPESDVFSGVLNITNRLQIREHISPEYVREETLRRELLRRRKELTLRSNDEELIELATDEISELTKKLAAAEEARDHAEDQLVNAQLEYEDDLRRLRFESEALKAQLESVSSSRGAGSDERLRRGVSALLAGRLTAAEALELLRAVYGDVVLVLDTAEKSAREWTGGENLFVELVKLVTEYRDELRRGRGDGEARQIFGKNKFAASESETTANNKRAIRARTFRYDGKDVYMPRHLKFGVEEDALRVHFHWDAERELIVIGHCGRHLPLG